MELYILDNLYRRTAVIDKYISLIWTERFSRFGDFQLNIASTLQSRSTLTAQTMLSCSESARIMTIKTVEDTEDDDGNRILILKGTSAEEILASRPALAGTDDSTTTPKWTLTGTPTDIVRQMFHDICVTGIVNAGDIITNVVEASIFPEDTIGEPPDSITVDVDPKDLYSAITDIADAYDFGFRLVNDGTTAYLYWDVYMGSDRTTQQTSLPAVIFSQNLDNLHNTTAFTSTLGAKNVAYVRSPVGFEVVYADLVDTSVNGFDRNVLMVEATDITDTDSGVASALMILRGKFELAKNRSFSGFDGEVSQSSQYTYGVDYYLGDLVEVRNSDGATSNMQVTEQIFVSDEQGFRSYPTLSINSFITAGSWLAWDYHQVWQDLEGSSETWADQP
jgi:hypothetical protein